jgi:hypothetical protein
MKKFKVKAEFVFYGDSADLDEVMDSLDEFLMNIGDTDEVEIDGDEVNEEDEESEGFDV